MMRLTSVSLLLLATMGHVQGARIKVQDAATKTDAVSGESANATLAQFTCPDECQECCAASWMKAFIPGNLGRSSSRFKCILKAKFGQTSGHMPSGRSCTAPKMRNKASGDMAKTECDYFPQEAGAYKLASMQKCSSYSKCCCDKAEDWTEDTCHHNGDLKTIRTRSQTRGSMESWEKDHQTYDNKEQRCQLRDSAKHAYQTGPYAGQSYAGCCTRTRQETHVERYECGSHIEYREVYDPHASKKKRCRPCKRGEAGCTHPGNADRKWCRSNCKKGHCPRSHCKCEVKNTRLEPHVVTDYCDRYISWNKCVEWEQLFVCSNDNGVTQSGFAYSRFSTKLGQCVGDSVNAFKKSHLQLHNYRCPANFVERVAGRQCQCGGGCGR